MPGWLSPQEVDALIASLDGWQLEAEGKALRRELTFADFRTAWAFIQLVATEADRMDHHPDWSNSYNRVSIRLTSHDAGGLTARDESLARFIDRTLREQASVV
ncbi:4a-hydroxytetrahydrobiopterin dehydratase [Asticcacaulis sp. EMRT-3]|uniref:4a-hydroxytetrahydrobiopterin dehydratase n=1 Tax=Asticcacaulis sp. EMRT-3 TaxID=3040349 RepID=UPI0024AF6544|nr:4a-hydroxytetrahydrobiopterin dehydratase [Asticcacaulis sp. EMRT-3]MDI7775641.1 4a-hydroxytetrahydrobiopterin dehydratase [Asticcacaulis sp. EMRT-3]